MHAIENIKPYIPKAGGHPSKMSNQDNDSKLGSPAVPPPAVEQQPPERNESVDSAAFFESQDEYDEYDDFGAAGSAAAGGGGGASKQSKRQDHRGGSGGSGTIYSAKHVRQKEALQNNTTKRAASPKKK